jgi:hypothetical protein
MNIKIFCRCSLFPSWSGYRLISTPVAQTEVEECRLSFGQEAFIFLGVSKNAKNETSKECPAEPNNCQQLEKDCSLSYNVNLNLLGICGEKIGNGDRFFFEYFCFAHIVII